MENKVAIKAGRILTPLESFSPGTIVIQGEKIAAVGPSAEVPLPPDCPIIDAADKTLIPGFVDTHIHAGRGHYFGDDEKGGIDLCQGLAQTGTTSVLPTLETQPEFEEILRRIWTSRIRSLMTLASDTLCQVSILHQYACYRWNHREIIPDP